MRAYRQTAIEKSVCALLQHAWDGASQISNLLRRFKQMQQVLRSRSCRLACPSMAVAEVSEEYPPLSDRPHAKMGPARESSIGRTPDLSSPLKPPAAYQRRLHQWG